MVPPAISWTRRFDEVLETPGVPSTPLNPAILFHMLPMIIRMGSYIKRQKNLGFDPINMFNRPQLSPTQGVPLGGLGGGSIGRGWRGEFQRWQLRPGMTHQSVVWADAFSVRVERPGHGPAQSQVLLPEEPTDGSLASWAWDLDEACASYQALFPRAWTTYDQPVPGLRLTCRQVSPFIPNNYRESSFPVSVFAWEIENTGSDAADASLMFSFQNGTGASNDQAGGHSNHLFQLGSEDQQVTGVRLHHIHRQRKAGSGDGKDPSSAEILEDPLDFAIAVAQAPGLDVTYRTRFATTGSGRDLWDDFTLDGTLEDLADERPAPPASAIGAALAVKVHLAPGEKRSVTFSLAWDMPRVHTGLGTPYFRRYARFYHASPGEAAPAERMAQDALLHFPEWEAQIEAWQAPILADASLPDWYKIALFNELYYLVEGGTLWAYSEEEFAAFKDSSSAREGGLRTGLEARASRDFNRQAPPEWPTIGHFAYLEGLEYPMYNTYDVHFYASYALAMLFPQIDLSLQRDFAAALLLDQPEQRELAFTGKKAPRKVRGAIPHDLGWPTEDVWKLVNGYFIHDVNEWKDLNLKFVLQVYRDYAHTADPTFARACWPAVLEAMAYIARFDRDNDGLIENDSFPDQTYDTWTVSGPSAYTGGLWLAALSAAAALADALGQADDAAGYRATLAKGTAAYLERLWNGRYFNYQRAGTRWDDSVMADQLAGQWYALASGLPPVIDPEKARTALQAVYEFNVQGFQDGRMGAVNGMRPDGSVDRSNLQSQEVWVGTTYALAAAMLQAGLDEQAFATARGVYECTYERFGYWFQTPEAWDAKGSFRSSAYMRPLAIWAMQWELEKRFNTRTQGHKEEEP
jgi:non-lysosomal glucosylceramidase